MPPAATEIKQVVQEQFGAVEAVWSDNAEGLPQADVVIIRPGESANRRFYPKEALEEAQRTGFWDDAPMFINHGDKAMPRKRQIQDLAAKIEKGSTYIGAEGEVRGKVTFINPEFAAFAKRAGPHIGLSGVHEFMGQRYRGNDGHYHERVNKLVVRHSVDFVAFPAAGGEIAQFLPAQESEDDVDYKSPLINADALTQHRPELVDELIALRAAESGGGNGDGDDKIPEPPKPQPEPPQGFVSLTNVRTIVQEEVGKVHDSYRERDKKVTDAKVAVVAHVAKSGLPEPTKNRLITAFEGQEAYDKDAVQAVIDTAAEELSAGTGWRGPKVLGLGDSTAQEGDDKGDDPDTLRKDFSTMMAVEDEMAFVPRTGRRIASEAVDAGKAN